MPKGDGDEDEESNEIVHIEVPEPVEEGLMTPTSSVEQATAPLTTPIDALPMTGARSLPGSFAVPEPLSFESRQDRGYYATPPHYTDSFSQPMLNTPVSTEMISPHDVSVFDYSTQNSSFSSSSPDHSRHAVHGAYDSWGAPTFRQDIFSPVGYTATPTSQTVHPPSMAYHMPMTSPALHDMSHPNAQSPMDSMGQRALPFRTGSLGHPNGMSLSHPA